MNRPDAGVAKHPVVVRAGFQRVVLMIGVPSLLAAIGIDAYRIWRFNLPVVDSSLVTVGAALLAVAMLELGVYLGFVREVRLYHDRVVFIKGLRQVIVSWRNLTLPTAPYGMGLGFTYSLEGGRPSQEWLWVSKTTARAILTHPSYSRASVDQRVLRSVGL